VFTFGFTRYIFRHRECEFESLVYDSIKCCEKRRGQIQKLVIYYRHFLWIVVLVSFIVNFGNSVFIALLNKNQSDNYYTQPKFPLVYDTIMTIITFALQVVVNMGISVYISLLCSLHVIQIENLRCKLQTHIAIKDLVADYEAVLANINSTSIRFQLYLSVSAMICLISLVITITDAVWDITNMSMSLRLIYVIIVFFPFAVSFWKAASVSSALEILQISVPLREAATESSFLLQQFVTGIQSNKVGFTFFGVVLKKRYLLQAGYLCIIGLVSYLQYLINFHQSYF